MRGRKERQDNGIDGIGTTVAKRDSRSQGVRKLERKGKKEEKVRRQNGVWPEINFCGHNVFQLICHGPECPPPN